jgi:calcium-binding protein CML
MGCGASTAAPGSGDGKPIQMKDHALKKGIMLAGKGEKGKYSMPALFAQFDADGDGKLDIYELARAFRAIGLEKRQGGDSDMDKATFKSFDTDKDGYVDMKEIDANMNDKLRAKIEKKIEMGWEFDKEKWDASVKRHNKWDMKKIFAQFDADGDGKLDIYQIARAFRALGLPKRDGTKMEMDKEMFKSFDTNGDGYVSMEEFDKNLKPKTRRKIELALEAGWKFDKAAWDASVARHNKYKMKDVFSQFDADGDGKLDIYEFARAFRALGLPKRDGSKMEMDKEMFKSFDTNGDGYVSMEELDANMKPKTRRKIELALEAGWKFDKATWDASVARHKKYDMGEIFKQFDADGDGKLDIYEIARAFRAMGLTKREGEKSDMDKAMFKSLDEDGDGLVDMDEIRRNLNPKVRRKIELSLDAGWTFDKEKWDASVARHKKWDMKQVFAQFDVEGTGKLDIYQIARAFRALGLPKRDGTKMEMDKEMFKSFDTNGDGYVSMEEFDKNLKPKTRRKIENILEAGWTFDKAAWDASVARHKKYDMKQIFAQFDADGDGKLDIYEIARAFRAMGLPKRDGEKMEMDKAMFKSFDTDGDGYVSMEELDANLKPKTRRKIELALEAGWKFDKPTWDASVARHKKYNMADIFKGFDTDGDGKLTMREFQRAFRAMGLPKRDGTKMEVDKAMFDSFDTDGDGYISLVEFQENIQPKTRRKIELKLESGWKFDEIKWAESAERHKDDPKPGA